MIKKRIDITKLSEEEAELLSDELYSYKKTNKRKSVAALFIYLIIMEHSTSENHLSQNEIADLLREEYEVVLERKAIGRIIHNITDSGLGIFSLKGYGTWYDSEGDLS
jgi:hypothetical protein